MTADKAIHFGTVGTGEFVLNGSLSLSTAMSNSSLSTVVSDLVRASVGTSISNSVTDEDLDKAVAELILKEAKQKAERYLKDGVQVYLPDPEYVMSKSVPSARTESLKTRCKPSTYQ